MTQAPDPLAAGPQETGLTLQRGGEELLLDKVTDRFTTQLRDPAAVETLAQRLQPDAYRPVAQGQLVEWVVPAPALEDRLTTARSHPAVAFASHVYRPRAHGDTWVYLTQELTVQFAATVTVADRQGMADALGLGRDRPLVGIPNTFIYAVGPSAIANPIKLANQLIAHPGVLLAEPNVVIATAAAYRPADSLYSQQWHLAAQGSGEVLPDADISVERAWDMTRGARSVVIAVTDDGFDLNHRDLQGPGKIVAPMDLKSRDAVPLPGRGDESHGTACAGLAIAEENQTGVVGVAPGCGFMPIRTTGFLDDTSIEQLFRWATDQGAAVISCSWSAASVYFPLSLRQRHAITQAATQGRNGLGCVVVFSAGNANRPVSGTVQETGWPDRALQGATAWLSGFGVHPDVITVAACTSQNRKAAYSNWGDHIALCAPSNNAPPSMALPKVGAVQTGPVLKTRLPGRGMVTSDRLGSEGYSSDGYTRTFGGTSSACPVVAGVAGLVLSANPDLTAREVRHILEQTADKITDPNPDPQLGHRYGTYDQNGHSRWFGHGRVNAHRAVLAARQRAWQRAAHWQRQDYQDEAATTIPDGVETPLVRTLTVAGSGAVQDVAITVVLEHEHLGDVTVALKAPTGQMMTLQGRSLGNQTQLNQRYDLTTTPALRGFLGQVGAGGWQLWVQDHAPGHSGRLVMWALMVALG
jgi:subtilisin family serine protease